MTEQGTHVYKGYNIYIIKHTDVHTDNNRPTTYHLS